MASQVQLAKMTEKLGGVMVFCGTPLPPIANFPTKTTAEAQAAATYFGTDMRWMLMYGQNDGIFEAAASKTLYTNLLTKLGAAATIKINHIEVGGGHFISSNGWANMVKFINGANAYDSSTEVTDWSGYSKGGEKDGEKEGEKEEEKEEEKTDEDWCEWYGTCTEGSKVLTGSVISSLVLTALQYF